MKYIASSKGLSDYLAKNIILVDLRRLQNNSRDKDVNAVIITTRHNEHALQ